ncbi:small ribosomal subunit Rsm22 family protein [Pseudodesulfovibrio piezophilus]|uniref:Ribosomal small subunit Rsm22 n=1 Tax=Pseudodesulfovibrio piezophilus (strain DSM 21447 / JCM 15486 / C1TLV30) TaxID=1322246 RepID=M1WYP6_PSEP2|nr:small ribosomal subunit Rsm22 family protein [Pseudodesulfovibrio piezophilus]CCH50483.1 Ribosomal small subunit Rsm22 [Pseudodesulfovibrio piezophilus C1TLV30]
MSIDRLFPNLTPENEAELDRFGDILKQVWPLKAKHREQLKYDIRDMSRGLTSERSERKIDYMSEAKFLSPYLTYFLPWNLYRMSRLFSGLELDIPDGAEVTDIGSGPLTAILALWMSRPHLRERKLNFTCMDRAPKSLQAGLKLFQAVAGKETPWRIKTVKANFTDRINRKSDLIIVANALNELDWSGRVARPQAEQLTKHLTKSTKESGRILLIETGVRLTGRLLAEMREQMMLNDFNPLAPCPHTKACPMPATGQGAPWCHFNFSVKGAPKWLELLSGEARLEKNGVSLNFLYLSRKGAKDWGAVRTISEPFRLHGGMGQYACSDKGLTLVEYDAKTRPLYPGQIIVPNWPKTPKTDLKSKAVLLPYKKKATQ